MQVRLSNSQGTIEVNSDNRAEIVSVLEVFAPKILGREFSEVEAECLRSADSLAAVKKEEVKPGHKRRA